MTSRYAPMLEERGRRAWLAVVAMADERHAAAGDFLLDVMRHACAPESRAALFALAAREYSETHWLELLDDDELDAEGRCAYCEWMPRLKGAPTCGAPDCDAERAVVLRKELSG